MDPGLIAFLTNPQSDEEDRSGMIANRILPATLPPRRLLSFESFFRHFTSTAPATSTWFRFPDPRLVFYRLPMLHLSPHGHQCYLRFDPDQGEPFQPAAYGE